MLEGVNDGPLCFGTELIDDYLEILFIEMISNDCETYFNKYFLEIVEKTLTSFLK